jgi:hypothetical protein
VSRLRFGLLVALLAAVVGTGSFALALTAFDDDGPDTPPDRSDTGAPAPGEAGADPSTTTTAPAPEVRTDALDTPAWILVIVSERDREAAARTAADVAAAGHPAGVLRSDDYPSMNRGFWVAYAGPYADADAARAAEPQVEGAGWPAAYVRCAGTSADCGGDQGEGRDGGDGGDEQD